MDSNCHVDAIQKTATAEERQVSASALLTVQGMGCPNCAARVRNSLLSLTGVVEAQVLLELALADVTYNPNLTNIPALINAVAQAGGSDGRHHYQAQLVNGPGVEIENYA
jgi:copper chaperone CopZ